jgi:hypothetical protein
MYILTARERKKSPENSWFPFWVCPTCGGVKKKLYMYNRTCSKCHYTRTSSFYTRRRTYTRYTPEIACAYLKVMRPDIVEPLCAVCKYKFMCLSMDFKSNRSTLLALRRADRDMSDYRTYGDRYYTPLFSPSAFAEFERNFQYE